MIFLFKNNLFIFSLMLMLFTMMSMDFFQSFSNLYIYNFYFFNTVNFSFPLLLDQYSVLFSMIVFFISSNIMKFSSFYLSDEKFKTRFLMILLLFIFSMIFLIFVPNLVFLMVGWDGLGMSSFYLIMYYHNQKSLGASMLTMLSNRIGDLCLILSIGLFFSLGTSFVTPILMLSSLLLVGCFTKSAQFPFMSWLPAAMAAPTPVSALVHSSTLVTAGVYLMIRFFSVILNNSSIIFIIALVSSLTMLISALSAMFETDFKKIIALSTLSQLGFMMFSISQMMKMCGFFHLLTHAIFKSLLFICAGVVIILSGHNQDIRALPKFSFSVVQSCFIISSLALMSTPFMVGFYSKDLILEMLFQNYSSSWALMLVVFFSSWLTVAYSIRMMYLSLWQTPNLKMIPFFSSKNLFLLNKSVFYSATGSIVMGSILSWLFFNESKSLFPFLLSSEMFFICTFIILGILTFIATLNIKSAKPLLMMMFLAPIFQYTSEPVFLFSKKLVCFSEMAWLEKLTYYESVTNSMKSSLFLYKIVSKTSLMKQMIVILMLMFLLKCF